MAGDEASCPASTRPLNMPPSHPGSFVAGLVFGPSRADALRADDTEKELLLNKGYCGLGRCKPEATISEPWCSQSQGNCEGDCKGQWCKSEAAFNQSRTEFYYTLQPDPSYTYALPAAISAINSAIYANITGNGTAPLLQPKLRQLPRSSREMLKVKPLKAVRKFTPPKLGRWYKI